MVGMALYNLARFNGMRAEGFAYRCVIYFLSGAPLTTLLPVSSLCQAVGVVVCNDCLGHSEGAT